MTAGRIISTIGDRRKVTRQTHSGPGWARISVDFGGQVASIDITLTRGGDVWINTRSLNGGANVKNVATLDMETGIWA